MCRRVKKRNIQFLMWGVIYLSFSAFFFFAAAFLSGNLKKHTPAAIELYNARGLNVSMEQAVSFAERGWFAAASVGEKIQVTDLEESKSVTAYYQTTTSNYGAYANLHFTEGGYFSADVSAEYAVVIPKSLSVELFAEKSGKKILYMNEIQAVVCGVYEDGDLLVQLGSANIPVIYGNAWKSSDLPAEHLLLEADAGKAAIQQKQETAVIMETPLEGEMNDFGRLHQLGDSILLLGFFFSGLWFIFRFCIFSYHKFISAYECKEPNAKRGFTAFLGLGVFFFTVIGFGFLLQLVRIPAVYLPENNIFDISYYGQEVLNGIQQMNTDCRIMDFSRICAVYLCTEAGCLILAVPFFWAGCQRLRRGFLHGSIKEVKHF